LLKRKGLLTRCYGKWFQKTNFLRKITVFIKVNLLSTLSFFRIEKNLGISRWTLPRDDQLVVGVAAGGVAAAAEGEGAAVTETG
jgi:hypothetical protein